MKIFDSLVASNIRQRPLRSAISVVGVALGVALVMLFTGWRAACRTTCSGDRQRARQHHFHAQRIDVARWLLGKFEHKIR
jgi:hypothetical protein